MNEKLKKIKNLILLKTNKQKLFDVVRLKEKNKNLFFSPLIN